MIQIENLSKMYKIYRRRSDRLKEWFSIGNRKYHDEYWALKDITLTVPAGSVYGLIGMNGAGKSTLLKVLTGTTQPTRGRVQIEGRIAALLELGTGFHPEFTGRENVLINGKLLGLTDAELAERLEGIKAFSELGDFFDKPVRTYSSGMYVRLAFSLASSIDPDILIIDEALSVGDAYFQQKCLTRIRQFKEKGVTILFVSHDAGAVKLLCDHVALLDKGKIISAGSPVEQLELYNALLAKKEGQGKEYQISREGKDAKGRTQSGTYQAEILSVEIEGPQGDRQEAVVTGSAGKFVVTVRFNHPLVNPTVGIMIRDRLGYDIFGTNTAEMGMTTGAFAAGEERRFVFHCLMNMGAGHYTVTAAIHSSFTHVDDCYHWVDRLLTFNVLPPSDHKFLGVAWLSPSVAVEPAGKPR